MRKHSRQTLAILVGGPALNHPIKDNSLSIVLFVLFAICISVQSVVGWRLHNDTLAAHAQASISYWHFLPTGAFLEGLASNWQAAVLQLGSLIAFSSFLYQRGAPHSRDPGKAKRKHRRREAYRFSWFYRNSLLVAFLLLFALSLGLHIIFGTKAYNEQRALAGQSPISIGAFSSRLNSGRQPWNLAGGIFGDHALRRAHNPSASAGFAGIEAARIQGRNNRRGEHVSETLSGQVLR